MLATYMHTSEGVFASHRELLERSRYERLADKPRARWHFLTRRKAPPKLDESPRECECEGDTRRIA